MSELPSAAAQAAAATACVRGAAVQGAVTLQSLPIIATSSFETVDAAGWVVSPLPITRAASALLTVVVPAAVAPPHAHTVGPDVARAADHETS